MLEGNSKMAKINSTFKRPIKNMRPVVQKSLDKNARKNKKGETVVGTTFFEKFKELME